MATSSSPMAAYCGSTHLHHNAAVAAATPPPLQSPRQQHYPPQLLQQLLRKQQEEKEKEEEEEESLTAPLTTPSARNISSSSKGRRRTAAVDGDAEDGLCTPAPAAGVSSFSSSISHIQPPPSVTSLPFNLLLLAARRASPSTPVLDWKMNDSGPFHDVMSPAASQQQQHPVSGQRMTVSARKLAATLWELQEIPLYKGVAATKMQTTAMQQHHHQAFLQRNSSGKRTSQLAQNFSPASSHVSQRGHRRTPIQHKLGEGARRHVHSAGHLTGSHSQAIRLFERKTGAGTQQINSPSNNETGADNSAITPSNSVFEMKALPGDTGYAPTTSSELLKVLNRIWSLEEQHISTMSLVSTLRAELDHAHAQVQELLHEKKLNCKEIDSLKNRLADERVMWHEQEQETVRAAVHSLKLELEDEKKSRRRLEILHRKITRDLTEMKATLGKALHDLERERKARELMEEVCDELAREIGEDKAEVEELKRESAKVREEVEEERKMLQMAEVWREERVQMKLAEARLELEEKNAAVDKLRSELEAFLRAKKACDARNERKRSTNLESERCRSSINSLRLHDTRITARNSVDSGYPNEVGISGKSSVEPVHLREVRDVQEHDEEGSIDDDLHSIELYNDSSKGNMGSNPWSHLQQVAENKGRGCTDQKSSTVDRVDRGKQPEAGKVQGIERARGFMVDSGIAAVENKEKGEQWDSVTDSQWIDRTIERGELREWSRDKRFAKVAIDEANISWQSDQEESQDHVMISARPFGRNLHGHTDTLVRSGSTPVEGIILRPGVDTIPDSFKNNAASKVKILGSVRDLHTGSGLTPMPQPHNVTSSPTRQWNHYWSSPDPGSPHIGRTTKNSTDAPNVAKDNSLKAKLLEAKLEGQHTRLRTAKGL